MIIKNTAYYYIGGILSQVAFLASWTLLQNEIGLSKFGAIVYMIGLLEFASTVGLLGFDSFILRHAKAISKPTLNIFWKIQLIYCILILKIYAGLLYFFDITYNYTYLFLIPLFIMSIQSFLVSNAFFVATGRSKRSAAMQIARSLLFLFLLAVSPKNLLIYDSWIILLLSVSYFLPAQILKNKIDLSENITPIKRVYIQYAPQFYLSAIVGIGYMVLFRTILKNDLNEELFGYFMFVLMIFNQLNGLWTSAFKALLPSVFDQKNDISWLHKIYKFCIYISLLPFLTIVAIKFLPLITSTINVARYPDDTILLLFLIASFAMSGMVTLQSTVYYKNTKGMKLFYVSLITSLMTLILTFILSRLDNDYFYTSLVILLQWTLNYLGHAFAYREMPLVRSIMPLAYIGINTILCLIVIT